MFVTGDESVELSAQLETSVNIGEHAFAQMQGDLDRQRLLGERPPADPLADIMLKQMQQKERYEYFKSIFTRMSFSRFTLLDENCRIQFSSFHVFLKD